MIIDNASFEMSATHSASRSHSYKRQSSVATIQDAAGVFGGLLFEVADGSGGNNYTKKATMENAGEVTAVTDPLSKYRQNLQLQFETLNYLFKMLLAHRLSYLHGGYDPYEDSGEASAEVGLRIKTDTETYTYAEAEETSFSTTGRVRTADGREIEFGIEMSMSRSFYAQYSQEFTTIEPALMDPLVINLDGGVADVSDQKFFFDLDCDGSDDEISMLSGGNGFLALDKNGDGIINDGSELFGAKTGEGFKELGEYDLDKNGWIDEADEIYRHLRVWTKDENGNDRLFTLKEAGVGAISLSAMGTEFSLKDVDNSTKARIRSTGFFLHENGVPGMIQQLDMAM